MVEMNVNSQNQLNNNKLQNPKVRKTGPRIFKILSIVFVYFVLLLMYAPILLLIVFSFTPSTLIGNWNGFSFELYKDLFTNQKVMTAVGNTFLVAISSAVVSTALGTLGAIGIFYSRKRVRKAFEIAGQIPILNPEIVTALSLTLLFVFIGANFNFLSLLIGHVVLTVPFVVLSINPKLKQLDTNIYEAALDLGAKPATALRKVIIPEILPGIFAGFILSITLSLDDYIITAFTKNPSFETLSTFVYGITSKTGALPPSLRALTTLIFIGTLVVLLIINFYNNKNKKKEGRKK